MSIIKKETTHTETEKDGALLSADRTVTKAFGISLKSEFNATITDKASGAFLMGLSHTASGANTQQGIDYQNRMVEAFKNGSFERTATGSKFVFPREA